VGQFLWFTATNLQSHRMLALVEPKESLPVAMENSPGGDHLGVEHGVGGELPMKKAAVAIGPIHHRGHAEAMRGAAGGLRSDGHSRSLE